MKNATMLYKHPGPHNIHDDKFDYVVVDEDDIEKFQADGWFLTTPDAKAAYDAVIADEKAKMAEEAAAAAAAAKAEAFAKAEIEAAIKAEAAAKAEAERGKKSK